MICRVKIQGSSYSWTLYDKLGLATLMGERYETVSKIISHIGAVYPGRNVEIIIPSNFKNA